MKKHLFSSLSFVLPLALGLTLWLAPSPASAVPTCGHQTHQNKCGRSNFCYCCGGTCANCVWWAWEAACRNWGFAFSTCNDAHRWNEQAKGRGEPTGSSPRNSSVFVCEKSATCSNWGHVGWVVTAHSNGSFSSTEQFCGGTCGTHSRTRSAGFATGGFIYNPKGTPPPPQCSSDSDCKDPAKPKCDNGTCVAKPPSGCTHVKVYRTGGVGLRIRASSTTSSSQIGSAPEGACLPVKAKTTSGQSINGDKTWYKITYNGITGWVAGYYATCSSCGGPPPACSSGQTRSCYTGPSGTKNVGICKDGTQTCSGGNWGSCSGQITPQSESCNNGKDDDCDGKTDEGCTPPECTDGKTKVCYTGPAGTAGKGICKEGIKRCSGGKWGSCSGQVKPKKEACGNNKDDDCDGKTDEGCPDCKDRDGDGHKAGLACTGTMDCDDNDKNVYPGAKEICNNNKDDNCDGKIDENCGPPPKCTDGQTEPCYTGPAATKNKGICREGKKTCTGGTWSGCAGQVLPNSQEVCGNGQDDNCNGQTDENCSTPPPPGCTDNDQDGYGIGSDCLTEQDCDDNDKNVHPGAQEVCNNNKDDNCNNQTDENCNSGNCSDKDQDGYSAGPGCTGPIDCDDNNKKIHPKAPEICGNGIDEDCQGGDLFCKKFGEFGCTDHTECETGYCIKRGESTLCSKTCPDGKCPDGYTCISNTACWPGGNNTGGNQARACNVNADCKPGELCKQGVCTSAKSAPKGCNCAAAPSSSPSSPALLWLLILAALLRLRRRRPQNGK